MEKNTASNPNLSFLQSEKFYRLLYENSKDAIMVLSPEYGFVAGNDAAIKLFGCVDEAEFLKQTPISLSPERQPDGRLSSEESAEMIELAKKNGSNYFQWVHKKISGQTFPAMVLLSWSEIDGEGLLQATVRDVTPLKKIESDLIEANTYLNNLLDFSIAPTIVWDSKFIITRFNRSFEKLTGRKASDVVGQSVETLFLPGDVESPMELLQKTLWQTVEIKVPHVNGTVRDVLWDSVAISVSGNKETLSTVTQGRDMSEYKKLEDSLRFKIDELEKVNRLTNEQLEDLKSRISQI